MLLHRWTTAVLVVILLLSATACIEVSPTSVMPTSVTDEGGSALESPLATPDAAAEMASPTSTPGKGSVAGRLIDFNTGQPMVNQNLSLPSVICPPGVLEENKREECVYVVDEAFDPSVLTDGDGRFVFRDIPVGEYVLLVGTQTTKYTVLANELDQPIIWGVEADKVNELGDLVVELH
jgi:hypothetical protein